MKILLYQENDKFCDCAIVTQISSLPASQILSFLLLQYLAHQTADKMAILYQRFSYLLFSKEIFPKVFEYNKAHQSVNQRCANA